MDKIKKVLINRFGKKFYFRGSDVHTKFGVIKEQDIVKAKDGDVVKSNLKECPQYLDLKILKIIDSIKEIESLK